MAKEFNTNDTQELTDKLVGINRVAKVVKGPLLLLQPY